MKDTDSSASVGVLRLFVLRNEGLAPVHTLDEVAHGRGHELYAGDCLGILHACGANRTNSAHGLIRYAVLKN